MLDQQDDMAAGVVVIRQCLSNSSLLYSKSLSLHSRFALFLFFLSKNNIRKVENEKDIGMESSRPKQKNEWNEAFVYNTSKKKKGPTAHL
jgi:hypothetical protein